MPTYEYEATNLANKASHKGIIEAASMEAAIKLLIGRHIFPSHISELSSAQVEVVNRIANLKKFVNPKKMKPVEPEVPDLSLPASLIAKPRKRKLDWTYIVIVATIAALLMVWALVH